MRWLWLAAAVLLGVAAVSVYMAFQSPTFVAGLAAMAAGAVWKAIKPSLARDFSPEHAAKVRDAARRNDPLPSRIGPRHPGEQR